ncbi:MAG: flagellar basal-body rod protein FlgF [Planctomycetota bacterium]|nr:flagellar basal-body rod protein FlgF [Planctomycetota bacterium]
MGENYAVTATSLDALAENYRTIANNLANASTPGFKRTQSVFLRELTGRMGQPAAADVVSGTVREQGAIDLTPGAMTFTGRPLDVALGGTGFLVVETPSGEFYTRNGTLSLNSQRQLVDGAGRTIAGEGGPIVLPPQASEATIQISADGSVAAAGQAVGKLKVVTFDDPQSLRPVGQGCFAAVGGGAVPATNPKIAQGFREGSNVSPVEELVGLISVTRLYEANIRTLKTLDERLASLNRVVLG